MNDPDPFMCFEAASPTAIEVPVLKVFDGDGFRTKIALRELTGNPNEPAEVDAIRFAFIDAPELEQRGGRDVRNHRIRHSASGTNPRMGLRRVRCKTALSNPPA